MCRLKGSGEIVKRDWARGTLALNQQKLASTEKYELQTQSKYVYDPLIWVLYQEEAEVVAVGRCWGTLVHLCLWCSYYCFLRQADSQTSTDYTTGLPLTEAMNSQVHWDLDGKE